MRIEMKPLIQNENTQKWLAFLAGFALLLIYLLMRNEQENPYDAWTYTQMSLCFIQNGLFNFLTFARDFGEGIRGYLFPWILAACHDISLIVPWFDYRFAVSAFTSLVCAVLLPDLVCQCFGIRRMNFFQRLLIPALLLLYWNGLLAYALTDIWGAGFAVIAVYGLFYVFRLEGKSTAQRCAMSALCGFAMGAAYNVRTIYLFLMIGSMALLIVLWVINRRIRLLHKLIFLACLLVGFGIVSLPQMLINIQTFGSASFMLISKSGAELYINKLYDGIYIAKYESYTGVDYWYESMNYVDPAGQALLEQENLDVTFEFGTGATALGNIGAYIALVLKYPLDFIGIYARHLFSLLDIRYPNIYVNSFETGVWLPLSNYTLLFCALAAVRARTKSLTSGRKIGFSTLCVLLIPTVAILFGTIETRYGVMLYLVLWVVLAASIRVEHFKGIRLRSVVYYAIGYALFVGILCACNGMISASLLEYPLLY